MNQRVQARRIEQIDMAIASLMQRVANLPSRFPTGGKGGGSSARWFKVTTASDANGVLIAVAWDGATPGTSPVNIYSPRKFVVDDTLYAISVKPRIDVRFADPGSSSIDITYLQVPDGTPNSPVTLSASGSTARSTTWVRSTSGHGVNVPRFRTHLDGATQTITVYTWTEKYDADGRLYEVGAESSAETNTGTEC